MRKKGFFRTSFIVFICIACLSGCGTSSIDSSVNDGTNTSELTSSQSETKQEVSVAPTEEVGTMETSEETQIMNITLDGQNYSVSLDNNETFKDIMNHLPLDLSMVRYAEHEYYAELPYKPVFDENRTSDIKAGHVYYWDGWNAFVINYVDYDIAPYKVVHIGEITDKSIVDVLMNADEHISIQATE